MLLQSQAKVNLILGFLLSWKCSTKLLKIPMFNRQYCNKELYSVLLSRLEITIRTRWTPNTDWIIRTKYISFCAHTRVRTQKTSMVSIGVVHIQRNPKRAERTKSIKECRKNTMNCIETVNAEKTQEQRKNCTVLKKNKKRFFWSFFHLQNIRPGNVVASKSTKHESMGIYRFWSFSCSSLTNNGSSEYIVCIKALSTHTEIGKCMRATGHYMIRGWLDWNLFILRFTEAYWVVCWIIGCIWYVNSIYAVSDLPFILQRRRNEGKFR